MDSWPTLCKHREGFSMLKSWPSKSTCSSDRTLHPEPNFRSTPPEKTKSWHLKKKGPGRLVLASLFGDSWHVLLVQQVSFSAQKSAQTCRVHEHNPIQAHDALETWHPLARIAWFPPRPCPTSLHQSRRAFCKLTSIHNKRQKQHLMSISITTNYICCKS